MADMYRTSTLSLTDITDYNWPEAELARFGDKLPPSSDAGVKEASFQDDADAVVQLGPIVTSFKRLGLAIRDPRCHKPHLRVLYRLMECLNRTTGTAFPDRKTRCCR